MFSPEERRLFKINQMGVKESNEDKKEEEKFRFYNQTIKYPAFTYENGERQEEYERNEIFSRVFSDTKEIALKGLIFENNEIKKEEEEAYQKYKREFDQIQNNASFSNNEKNHKISNLEISGNLFFKLKEKYQQLNYNEEEINNLLQKDYQSLKELFKRSAENNSTQISSNLKKSQKCKEQVNLNLSTLKENQEKIIEDLNNYLEERSKNIDKLLKEKQKNFKETLAYSIYFKKPLQRIERQRNLQINILENFASPLDLLQLNNLRFSGTGDILNANFNEEGVFEIKELENPPENSLTYSDLLKDPEKLNRAFNSLESFYLDIFQKRSYFEDIQEFEENCDILETIIQKPDTLKNKILNQLQEDFFNEPEFLLDLQTDLNDTFNKNKENPLFLLDFYKHKDVYIAQAKEQIKKEKDKPKEYQEFDGNIETINKEIKKRKEELQDIKKIADDQNNNLNNEAREKIKEFIKKQEEQIKKLEQELKNKKKEYKKGDSLIQKKDLLSDIFAKTQQIQKSNEDFKKKVIYKLKGKTESKSEKLKINFYSINDFLDFVKKLWEIHEKDKKDRKEMKRLNFGKMMSSGGKENPLLPHSLKIFLESAEADYVREIDSKEGEIVGGFKLDERKPHELTDMLNSFKPSKDKLSVYHWYALANALADKGLLYLEDPKVWENFTFYSGIKMPEKAKINKKLRNIVLRDMINSSFGDGAYEKIISKQRSNFKNKLSESDSAAREAWEQEQETYAKRIIQDFCKSSEDNFDEYGRLDLNKFHSRPKSYEKNDNLNPHKFLQFVLDRLIKAGDGEPEDAFFLLIRSVSIGFIPLDGLKEVLENESTQKKFPVLKKLMAMCDKENTIELFQELDKQITGGKKYHQCNKKEKEKYFYNGDWNTIHKFLYGAEGAKWTRKTCESIKNINDIDKDYTGSSLFCLNSSEAKDFFPSSDTKRMLDPKEKKAIHNGIPHGCSLFAHANPENNNNFEILRNTSEFFLYFNAGARGLLFQNKFSSAELNSPPKHTKGTAKEITAIQYLNVMQGFIKEFFYALEEQGLLKEGSQYWLKNYFAENYSSYGNNGRKKQGEFLKNTFNSDFSDLITKNKKTFLYLLQKWQKSGAFPTNTKSPKIKSVLNDDGIKRTSERNLQFDKSTYEEYLGKKDPLKQGVKNTKNQIFNLGIL
jgi:hypothetical protein